MSFSISIYQRKRLGYLEWTTLGLGPWTVQKAGQSPTKLGKQITDVLRKSMRALRPAEVRRFELVRGRQLARVRLELSFSGENRGRASGLFPIVIEPRRTGELRGVSVAYHPLRQSDFFFVDPNAPLEDQARRFFTRAWASLGAAHVEEELTTEGRDVLTMLSFVERPPSLLDELPASDDDVFADLEMDEARETRGPRKKRDKYPRTQLKKIGVNTTTRAADGLLRAGRPREPWRSQLQKLLGGPRKTPVVLLGPPGVGKSTIFNRFVLDLLAGDDYPSHRNLDRAHEVWRISARRILAGMSRVGEWEQRCVELALEARDPRVVLWVEDLATFGRAGRSQGSDRALADLFRGPLARGEITMIGEARRSAWRMLEEDAPAFADLFTVLEVRETPPAETLSLLLHAAREIERQGGVAFEPEALHTLLHLAKALAPGSAPPGVAVDLLQRIGDEARFEAGVDRTKIGADEVVSYLSRRTGLPHVLLQPSLALSDEELERSFASHVMGQPDATQAAVDLALRVRAGLTDPRRPYATYLFTGPTGTGKTQMAKSIAGFLYGDPSRLLRFDMGEMGGPDAVPRLIGDLWQPRGALTEAVRQQPFSVVLFDEIEKAHPSVLHLLLSLLDEGRLTDATGEEVDFTRSVIVMTSNLGAKKSAAIGFGERADEIAKEVDRAVREFFPPEVFNRIDRIVPFRSLTPEVAERVTEKELAGLLARRGLADRHVFVFAHAAAVRRMAEAAFDERGGARSVQRWLDRAIAGLLSDELARTSHASMRIVRIYGGERGYRLHIEVLAEAEPDGAERELAGWIDRPLSALRPRLSEIAARLRAHVDSEAWASLETRMSELVAARGDPAAQRTLYWLDAFRAEHAALRDAVFAQLGLGRAAIPKRPHTGSRLRAAPPVRPFDREAVLDAIARTVFLERALLELEDPAEHAVLVEIARVGSGRRPPSYERAPDGFFEQLVRHYASARGEVVSAASRDERGRVRTASDPSVLLAARPSAVVLEIEGLAVRSLFAGEVGSHAWTSIAAGSEIVRVRIASGESAPGALDRHEEAEAHFDGALARGDAELPANPSALLPMVRRFSFDPPRPGELAPLEVEDFAAGHVEVATASDLSAALRATMLLQMSRSAT